MNMVTSFTPRDTLDNYPKVNSPISRVLLLVGSCPGERTVRDIIRVTVRHNPGTTTFRAVCRVNGYMSAGHFAIGFGSAKGGGYCLISEAAEAAMSHAGFSFEHPFGGRGEGAVIAAMEAAAAHLGYENFTVLKVEG